MLSIQPKIPERSVRNQMKRTISVRFERKIFLTTFEGGPLWPVWSFRSVGLNVPFYLTKLLSQVPPLHPSASCLQVDPTRSGLDLVRANEMYRPTGHMKFPRFQIGIFVEWKAPLVKRDQNSLEVFNGSTFRSFHISTFKKAKYLLVPSSLVNYHCQSPLFP